MYSEVIYAYITPVNYECYLCLNAWNITTYATLLLWCTFYTFSTIVVIPSSPRPTET